MNQIQHQGQKQQFKQGYFLSHQHLKMMQILHLSGFALQEYISNEIEINPVLEIDNDDENFNELETEIKSDVDFELFENNDQFERKINAESSNETFYDIPVIQYSSTQESLKEQIRQMNLDSTIIEIANYIIDELDDDGYLRVNMDDVYFDIGFSNGKLYEKNLLDEALTYLQSCDPPGIACRNLKECLEIQVKRKLKLNENDSKLNLLLKIIQNDYELLSANSINKIKSIYQLSDNDWKQIQSQLLKLQPKPITSANKYELMLDQIIPDFEVTFDGNEFYVGLTQLDSTKVKICNDVQQLYVSSKINNKKEVDNYVNRLIDEAQVLINALKERESTMLKIITSISSIQSKFIISGDYNDLKPMILNDVALACNLDISTVSRITSNKYIQLPSGIFSLKSLFMRNINPNLLNDSQNTAKTIQQEIKEIIDSEKKENPYSDSQLVNILETKGVKIARRTVVKYREALNIQNSKIRRSFKYGT